MIANLLTNQSDRSDQESPCLFQRNDPDDPLVQGLFVAVTHLRDPVKALDLAQALTRLGPENPLSYLALGLVWSRIGQLAEAHKAFEQAAYLANSLPLYVSCKIHFLLFKGDKKTAKRLLKELMTDFPDRWATLRATAHWLIMTGQSDQGAALLEQVLVRKRNDPITLALLADCRISKNQREEGQALLKKAAVWLPTLSYREETPLVASYAVFQAIGRLWKGLLPSVRFHRVLLTLEAPTFWIRLLGSGVGLAVGLALLHPFFSDAGFPYLVAMTLAGWSYLTMSPIAAVAWLRRSR
ncbi:MAG: hypothetical protein NZ959_05420 [Armatimonadetes bacterium]|nr:hypothetical protein [Armatimonadota bacterium]MDW8122081.1 hypothetical protein [Armatimonadota bacterium]